MRVLPWDFQYPLLDRISWNLIRLAGGYWVVELSVSTIGSYFLKHRSRWSVRAQSNLSVSTIGSYFLKLIDYKQLGKEVGTFSIHYWIVFLETLCRRMAAHRAMVTFSIHYWIVFLETYEATFTHKEYANFQYPLLDRISWNSLAPYVWRDDFIFQYPLLDRISWNTAPGRSSARLNLSFSIHYWIVFLETTDSAPQSNAETDFQYPLLDRISWNTDSAPQSNAETDFQYPLLDRISWNQSRMLPATAQSCLSVSTIGSYFLKPPPLCWIDAPYQTFSIHYWIVFLETWQCAVISSHAIDLSVSTIGSYFLKPVC